MGDYLKLFQTHAEYEAYITGSDKILPNVSYCEDNNDVHYNPWTDPRVIAKFNVENVTEPVMLYDADDVIGTELFSNIEIDGEEISISDLESDGGYYTFDTTGEHTVKYTLLDSEVIGDNAFSGCDSLTSITIPNSVTSIGAEAFSGCESLTSIRVESGNTVYDSRGNCNAIIETATNTLLYGCQNTIIPNSVTSIGAEAFSACSGLTSITIPSGVTSIGEGAFAACSNLTSIEIPSSVTSIGNDAFSACSSLTSINIPSGVTSIGNMAFSHCRSLTSINIPSSVTSIDGFAFQHCSSLTSINIPSSVTSIGNRAFYKCTSLESITSQSTTAPTIQTSTFENVKTGGTLYVPSGSTGYNVWMGTGNYYLGKYNWTKVEQ